jgi:hypothetical protein
MNRNSWIAVCLVVLTVMLSGCNKKLRNIFSDDLAVDRFEYQYMTAKAKLKYDDGEKSFSAGANIRMQRDSVIWISISPGLGIEAARVMVRPDSVFFIDRINKTYFVASIAQLSERYQFEFSFQMIESLLLGNLIYPYARENLVKYETGKSYVQNKAGIEFDNFIGDDTRKLERLLVTDLETNSTISVNYSDFQLVGDDVLPFEIDTELEYQGEQKTTTAINIGYNKAEIEDKPIKFPFNVPSRYTPM